jgi:hypothetical protein
MRAVIPGRRAAANPAFQGSGRLLEGPKRGAQTCCGDDRYQQGDLDGLCGIYSAVNALDSMFARRRLSFTEEDAQCLFFRICRRLEKHSQLTHAIQNGLQSSQDLKNYAIKPMIDFAKARASLKICKRRAHGRTLANFWKEMEKHFTRQFEECPTVILRLGDKEDHWTCIRHLDGDLLILVDSGDRKILKKQHCTTGKATKAQPYPMRPRQTWFLWVAG